MGRFSLPSSYDRWKTSTPDDEKVSFYCDNCGEAIMVDEEYVETSEGDVHMDCFDEFAREHLDAKHKFAEEAVFYGEDD